MEGFPGRLAASTESGLGDIGQMRQSNAYEDKLPQVMINQNQQNYQVNTPQRPL